MSDYRIDVRALPEKIPAALDAIRREFEIKDYSAPIPTKDAGNPGRVVVIVRADLRTGVES